MLNAPRMRPARRCLRSLEVTPRGRMASSSQRTRAHALRVSAHAFPPATASETAPAGSAASSAPSRCPFALQSSFLFTEPRPAKLTPLGEAFVFAAPPAPPPTAHLWLQAGVSGQDVPGRLTSGLRPLRHVEEWLPQDGALHGRELALKKAGLDSRRELCFQAEPRSLPAQEECLEMFLDYLPKRHPELYSLSSGEGADRVISVSSTGEAHRVGDYAAAPLELCNRLVQEDLVLMRAADEPTAEPFGGAKHVMTAASVVFSFGDLDKKLSSPLTFIHAPVPGFATELNKLLNKTFDALQPANPVWRNNWLLVESGVIDSPSFGTPEALAARKQAMPPAQRWLKVEYQTLRRLPATRGILFTVRTLLEPVTAIGKVPGAAAVLASSMRGMSPELLAYKGITAESRDGVLAYLDAFAS